MTATATSWAEHIYNERVNAPRDLFSDPDLLTKCVEWPTLALLGNWCGRLRASCSRHLLALLHALDAIVESFLGLAVGRPKDHRVSHLLSHLLHLLFLLLFLCLLTHLEEVRVEDLVWVQRVRIRIVLFVVGLVHAFELVVALGDARDRDTLVERLVAVGREGLVARVQLAALILENKNHAVGNAQELCSSVLYVGTLFELQVELDNVEVAHELLDLPIAALVHVKNLREPRQDLLLKDELRPVAAAVFLMW